MKAGLDVYANGANHIDRTESSNVRRRSFMDACPAHPNANEAGIPSAGRVRMDRSGQSQYRKGSWLGVETY